VKSGVEFTRIGAVEGISTTIIPKKENDINMLNSKNVPISE
jgi:hypothetical protein